MTHVGARKYYPGMGTGPAEVRWLDNEDLEFGDDADVTFSWDGTNLNILPATDNIGVVQFGNGLADIDVQIFMGAVGQSVLFDNNIARVIFEGTDLRLMDADILEFGDDADVAITWDGGSLNIVPLTDNVGVIEIGNGANDIDVQIFMNAAGQHVLFDVDVSRVIFTGVDLRLMDNDILEFGNDADVTITWDTDSLNILPLVNDTGRIEIGNGTESIDLIVFGSAAGNYLEWDNSADRLNIVVAGRVITGEEHAVDVTYRGTLSAGESMVGINVAVTPAGTGGNWVSAFFGRVFLTAADDPVPGTGYVSAAEFEVESEPGITPSDFAILVLTDWYDSAHAAPSAYIWLRSYGDTDPINLFNFYEENLASAFDSGRMVIETAASPAANQLVRCYVGGASMWLLATDTLPGS